jgi:hypothetical protein
VLALAEELDGRVALRHSAVQRSAITDRPIPSPSLPKDFKETFFPYMVHAWYMIAVQSVRATDIADLKLNKKQPCSTMFSIWRSCLSNGHLHSRLGADCLVGSAVHCSHVDFALELSGCLNPGGLEILAVPAPGCVELHARELYRWKRQHHLLVHAAGH